ncbi:MAG: hypothetical protein ABSB01_01925 [Streptosporangiaceae bacterium]
MTLSTEPAGRAAAGRHPGAATEAARGPAELSAAAVAGRLLQAERAGEPGVVAVQLVTVGSRSSEAHHPEAKFFST